MLGFAVDQGKSMRDTLKKIYDRAGAGSNSQPWKTF